MEQSSRHQPHLVIQVTSLVKRDIEIYTTYLSLLRLPQLTTTGWVTWTTGINFLTVTDPGNPRLRFWKSCSWWGLVPGLQKLALSTPGLSFECVWRKTFLSFLSLQGHQSHQTRGRGGGHTLMIPLNPNYLLKVLWPNAINYIGA